MCAVMSYLSSSCGGGYNKELLLDGAISERGHLPDCPQPGQDCKLEAVKGIEVSSPSQTATQLYMCTAALH